jgi:hypothetical protein
MLGSGEEMIGFSAGSIDGTAIGLIEVSWLRE